jgi:methionyl-tRNA synthetase
MISFEDFKKIELKIARITEVKDHPDADRLYVLKVDTGTEIKQLVAGIKKEYSPEELVNKKVVIINNLEPAIIRGVESQGMVLAAQDDNIGISVLIPDKDVAVGGAIH